MPIGFTASRSLSACSGSLLEVGWRRTLVFLLLALSKLVAPAPAYAASPVVDVTGAATEPSKIRLAQQGWGNTDPAELQLVLEAVADELGRHFPDRRLGTVAVVPGRENPMVLFEKGPSGEYVVQLSARDARWYQFVYQFSHELCHIYSNYDNKPTVDGTVAIANQWFEESLCEAAALYTLRKLASSWETAPPAPQWTSQAALFRKYADLLLGEPHRRLPASYSFAAWFSDNQHVLRKSPYLRDKDEVVSNRLLPLFERNPALWGAIAYLNANRGDATKGFTDYLEAWCLACPEEYRSVVEEIIALFGAAAPSRLLAGSQAS